MEVPAPLPTPIWDCPVDLLLDLVYFIHFLNVGCIWLGNQILGRARTWMATDLAPEEAMVLSTGHRSLIGVEPMFPTLRRLLTRVVAALATAAAEAAEEEGGQCPA
jgi:hypothetical protein